MKEDMYILTGYLTAVLRNQARLAAMIEILSLTTNINQRKDRIKELADQINLTWIQYKVE